MERLKHTNDIEIKLLPNRRFIYANRKSNIVISAEHLATEIMVLFPDEYEEYSKRVDFVNSKGKEWTEALYTPEYHKKQHNPHGFNKSRFHFTLPTEVTTEGELKMQFIAYKPDKSMTTVPFEVIPIDILDGVLAFKKNAKSNPDLLILAANQSTEALFLAQQATARATQAEKQVSVAIKTANAAKAESNEALTTAINANTMAQTAEQKAAQTVESANSANTKSDNAVNTAEQAKTTAKQAKLIAVTARQFAQSVVDRANNGDFKGNKGDKGDKGDKGQDGYVFVIDNFIGFYIDGDGNLYAYASETSDIDFRYDEESGNLYLISQ